MTEQRTLPPPKKKRSALYRQRRAAIIGIGVVALLVVAFIIVWTLTSRTVFEDFDGTKYYIRMKGGNYVLLDADKNMIGMNENLNYVTAAGTILRIDTSTGEYKVIAMVPSEGTEDLEFDYYSEEYDVLMYPKIERSEIASIKVVNEKDTITFVPGDTTKGEKEFMFEDYPHLGYDSTKFATLVNLTCYTVTMEKLDLSDPEKAYGFAANGYAEYGLPEREEDAKNYFIITKKDGTSHKVLIGDIIPSEAGYYVRYVGRDAVYLLREMADDGTTTTLTSSLLCSMEDYVSPYAVVPMASSAYFDVTDFTLYRVPENFLETETLEQIIKFSYKPIEERQGTFFSSTPYFSQGQLEGFNIHSYHADDCLQNLELMEPLRTVQINRPEKPLDEGTFAADYGVAYFMEFTYNDSRDGEQNVLASYPQKLWISPMTEDGTYFVFATHFDMVVEVGRSDMEFLEWTAFEWISDSIFTASIAYCKSLDIITKTPTAEGVTGVTLAKFTFDNSESSTEPTSNGQVDISNLKILADLVTNGVQTTGSLVNMDLFKYFYQTLLYTSLEGNTPLTTEQMDAYRASGDEGADMIIRAVYNVNGEELVHVFRFYQYSDRQTFVTLNGNGTFYMLQSRATKILNDLGRMLTGDPNVTINPQGKT